MEPIERLPAREDFAAAFHRGSRATGQYQCQACGYGISLNTKLPRCPMCGGESWAQIAASPLPRRTGTRTR